MGVVNTNLTYDVSFYGANRFGGTSVVSSFTDGSFSNAVGSTTLSVGSAGNYNSNQVATLSGLIAGIRTDPTASGRALHLQLMGTNGGSGYLNAMSVVGYIGYLGGSTNTLNGAPAAGYVANGTYPNSDSRSVNTVIGGGSFVQVNHADGIYYNSTLVMTQGGGTIHAGTNFSAYALQGSGDLAVTGPSKFSITHAGTYTGTLRLTNGSLNLVAANSLGSGGLSLQGGTLEINHAAALGSGPISVVSGTTTLNNPSGLTGLSGSNSIQLAGAGATLQVNGYGQILNLGSGPVTLTGTNNLNAWNGGFRLDGSISGSGLLNWYGAGSLVLGGTNTFSGTLRASGNNGTLTLANTQALQGAVLSKGTNHTVVFGVAGQQTYQVAGLSGEGDLDLGGNRWSISGSGTNTFSGILTGTNGLVLTAGTQIFDGALNITGTTQVSGGVLRIVKPQFSADLGAATLTVSPTSQAPIEGSSYTILNGPTDGARTVFFSPALTSGLSASFDPATSTVLVVASGPPVISSASSITHMYGSAFSYQITTSGSATSYIVTGLPAGLSLNPTTGLITGNLAGPTNTVVQISAINAAGTNTVNLVIDVTGQELLVDFGANPTTNAVSGKTWNNWTNGGQVLSNMVDSAGVSTGYRLGFDTDVAWGSNFGVVPSAGLGVFAESSAVNDGLFIVSTNTNGTTLSLTGLNPKSAYTFHLFGSRDAVETRATLYTLTGSNTVTGILTNSGSAQASTWGGVNYNPTNLLVASNLIPTRDGKISIKFQTAQGGFGYLNALRVTTTNYPAAASTYLSLANRWTDQNAIQAEPNGAVLFLGSSSIRRWESLTRDFADYKMIQRGMGGAVFSDIHQLFEDVAVVHNPRAVVLWAGVNDLYAYRSADYVMEQFTQFVATFTNQLPSAKLFYL